MMNRDMMNPALAGFLRGILWAVIVAVLEVLISAFTSNSVPASLAMYAPIIVIVLRTVEGEIDRRTKRS